MTRVFLEEKIRNVFDEFIDGNWCELNNSRLNSDSYSSIVNQQKYILKYYGAYFCELYEMYETFLRTFKGQTLNVLSLGCGSGVDCEALNRVKSDMELEIDINYLGIDIVDWNYRPNFDWANFRTMCVSELSSSDVDNVHLFVFPKSLTELNRSVRRTIGTQISTHNKQEKIYFINTYVTDCAKYRRVDGIEQFQMINRIMESNGWDSLSKTDRYCYKTNGGWLGYNYSFFKLPDELKPFVEELKDSCNDHNGSITCNCCDIDFIPILNSKYLAFNLLEYKRKSDDN
ncbi:hypothetical protein [Photobacterium sanguinicancri]|uniref:Class I SAM-dependent methyltransferase n=1 Tax=Photobacterium sanguinicancri TaxID=875932 RepID=A0AAW7Y5H0_9GAMM|nr:hypothetical protein [Photobacterium sanguinicancri]MDO6543687.1 hypothetical protein [Photobacterium sanguinicancri]